MRNDPWEFYGKPELRRRQRSPFAVRVRVMCAMKRGVYLRSRQHLGVTQKMRRGAIKLMGGRARNAPSCTSDKNPPASPCEHQAERFVAAN